MHGRIVIKMLVPYHTPWKLIALVIASLLIAAGALVLHEHGRQKGLAQARVECAQWKEAGWKAANEAQRKKEDAERDAAKRLKVVSDAYDAEIDRGNRSAAAARDELARLRRALASGPPADRERPTVAAAGPAVDGAGALTGELLGECAVALEELGREAGVLAAVVHGLQGYVREVEAASGFDTR